MSTYYESAQGLGDVMRVLERSLFGTRCYDFATLAAGSAPAKVKTTSNISFSIAGVMCYKAATDDLFVHTDLTVQAADTTKYYALCLDSSSNASIIQGNASALPPIPATKCMIGYIKVVTVAVTFTPATDSHAAAGVTTTYVNTAVVPATLA
jgi:hypothetical protein